ncbi:MAG TPA: glycosyltransferase, partial [Phycisphaerae bacterium]|nr:glycosyltransferase [Phycisphaerae bacterium]
MKILQVTMQFGRSYTQGTERYVATLSDTLRARGHEVQVLAGDPLRLGPKQKLGEPVAGENCLLYYPTRGWMTVLGLRPGRLAARLREHRPDIVHLNTPAHIGVGMMIACNRLGIPCVVTVHDYWWVCPKGTLLRPDGALCDGTPGWATCVRCMAGDHPRGWVRKLAAVPVLSAWLLMKLFSARAMCRGMTMADGWRWMWRRWFLIRQLDLADFAIFPSKAMAMGVASRLSHRRWKVIPNGLPAEWFENPRPPATAVKPPEELTIGYAGALAPHKAPHLLLEAVRLLGWR